MLRLLIACGIVMAVSAYGPCFKDYQVIKAVSLIRPNTVPPSGTKSGITGTIRMTQTAYGAGPTMIHVNLAGLPPNTPHGFHVHEYGDIITQGCQSAGGHYNPFLQTHAGPADPIRHVGDLGNVMSDGQGKIVANIQDCQVSLVGPYSVLGRSFVVHQGKDDLGRGIGAARAESLITGNAGARLGCGVIVHAP